VIFWRPSNELAYATGVNQRIGHSVQDHWGWWRTQLYRIKKVGIGTQDPRIASRASRARRRVPSSRDARPATRQSHDAAPHIVRKRPLAGLSSRSAPSLKLCLPVMDHGTRRLWRLHELGSARISWVSGLKNGFVGRVRSLANPDGPFAVESIINRPIVCADAFVPRNSGDFSPQYVSAVALTQPAKIEREKSGGCDPSMPLAYGVHRRLL